MLLFMPYWRRTGLTVSMHVLFTIEWQKDWLDIVIQSFLQVVVFTSQLFPCPHTLAGWSRVLCPTRHSTLTHACLYTARVYSWHLFLGGQTNLVPQTAGKLCAVNFFFCQDDELPIYHGNFLVMGNRHRKLFVVKQSKCSKIRLAAGLCPDTLGELIQSPRPLAAIGVPTSKGRGLLIREGEEGKGAYF